ncbi:MAG: hypothetical protein HZA59_03030 [Hydrogenophilales bacterium]|nr:hypothetical protein [Hydrogenophilales bacterium]
MISQRAKTGFENLLHRCLEESLRTEVHPAWQMQPVAEPDDIRVQRFMMLTLSSYDFRLMLLLHFSCEEASMKYVADSLTLGAAELPLSRYCDYIAEIGNNFCGALKRELVQYFPHLGMSTPNQLGRESLKHVKSWPIDHDMHIKAQSEEGAEFYGSLYVSSFGELDFDLVQQPKNEESVEMGTLELF